MKNIHIVCVGCNGRKRDLTLDELAAGIAGESWAKWATDYFAENRTARGFSSRLAADGQPHKDRWT